MLLHCPFIVILAVCATPVKWSLANEVLDHGGLYRSLQDTTTPDSDDTCAYVCDNIDEPSIQVQVVEVEAENISLFGSIMNRFNDFFDNGSRFGQFMNGLLNLFRPLQSNKPKYKVSTDVFVSALTEYSTKAKNLAASMRSESESYATASTTPDAVTTIFELSAENMDSVAAVIGPILEDLGQHETIDLTTVSCYTRQLLTHLRDKTLLNVVSIAKVLYTKTGNDDLEEMYDTYITARTSASKSATQASLRDFGINQCPNQGDSNTLSETSVQARLDGVGDYIGMVGLPLLQIIGLILLFPISFIVSLLTLVFGTFALIISLIFRTPLFPDKDNGDNGDDRIPDDDSINALLNIVLVLGLIGLPIIIPILIFASILQLFTALLSPFLPPDPNAPNSLNAMPLLLVVLESPMKSILDTLTRIYDGDESEDALSELNCQLNNMSCHNNALMASLSV